MTILRSAPRIPGHPMDLGQFENEWSHWTSGPAQEPRPWVVQDMFFAMSTRLKPGPVETSLFAQVEAGKWAEDNNVKPEGDE